MGRVTEPEPHIPPATRRAARLQRERDGERAAEVANKTDAGLDAVAEETVPSPVEMLAHTVPLPVLSAPREDAPSHPEAAVGDRQTPDAAADLTLPLRTRSRRRTTTGPTPTRVGARAAAIALTRREVKTAQLMTPSASPARHVRAPRSPRLGIVAGLAVIGSLVLGSTATMTAALNDDAVSGVAQGRIAPVTVASADASPSPTQVAPLPAPVEALPTPTLEAQPAALDLCSTPTFAAALTAGDDAAAIAAAGGAVAFRKAVATGAAPCVALDDPARVWVVLNKTRPNTPLDYRPSALDPPAGVRSIEGGSLRSDAAAALSAMGAASVAAGAGEIALQSGFRSYETQQTTYSSQVDAQGSAEADLSSARPGFSEHQSGLAGDVVACAEGCGTLDDLAATAQGQWIVAHSWEYGWITRYEEGYTPITGYSPEPWHLRYIGPELARAYHEGGWHTLEEFFGLPPAPTYL
jgi:D-alanyl-D-alanine carboxypeptidase